MITKLYTTHVVVYVQILSKLPVCLLKFGHRNRKNLNQNRARFRFGVRFRFDFGFGAYVKALIGFIVRGDRDSRANLMPIYGDIYQMKL